MSHFLTPVLALILWTLVIACVLYSRRIPAMKALRIRPDTAKDPNGEWKSKMPTSERFAAHNYNHLMEQPTIFYALMFTIFLMEAVTPLAAICAWGYVILRVIHSLIQITANKVMPRFIVFSIASILLIIMAVSTLVKLF